METVCSMVGCYSEIDDTQLYFYSFPSNFNMCMLWVQNCGTAEFFEDFAYGGAQPFVNKIICSNHFNSSDFNDPTCLNNGLKKDAVPILNSEVSHLALMKQEYEELDDAEDSFETTVYEDLKQEYQIQNCVKEEPRVNMMNLCSQNEFSESVQQSIQINFEQNKVVEEPDLSLSIIRKGRTYFKNEKDHEKSEKAFKLAWKRALETAEQREVRNRANALRNAFRRANETEEQRKSRNQANALRNATRRACETEEQKKERLYKNAVRAALRRSMETEEEQSDRKRRNALRAAHRRNTETEKQRAERRLKDKIRSAERRKKETDMQSKLRKYNDAVRAAFRRSNETEEQKQQRRLYDVIRAARRRSNETDEQRQKRLQTDRERAAKKRLLYKIHHNMDGLQTGFVDHSLQYYVDYDMLSSDSSKSEGSQTQCTNNEYNIKDKFEQCTNNFIEGNSDNSTITCNDTECDNLENNKKIDEFNNNCNHNKINSNIFQNDTDLTSFAQFNTRSSNDKVQSYLSLSEHSVNTIPEVVWCT